MPIDLTGFVNWIVNTFGQSAGTAVYNVLHAIGLI